MRDGEWFNRELLGETIPLNNSWYRGENCNFHPSKANLAQRGALDRFVIKGWAPDEPVIDPEHKTISVGSCISARFAKAMG
jgi:hypothetical protein